MDVFSLIAALILAAAFGVAGAAKLADRAGARAALVAFGSPSWLAGMLALALPLTELVIAVALLVPATRAEGATGALALLTVFTAAIAINVARGRAPDCHCFGRLHSAAAGWWTLARTAALAAGAAALAMAARTDAGPAPAAWLEGRSAAELALVAAGLTAGIVVVAGAVAILTLMRAYGRVLLRLDATEEALRDARIELPPTLGRSMPELGMDPGTPAPVVTANVSDGSTVTRDDLLAAGLPLLLVFTSPGCAPCRALMPRVAEWQHELAGSLRVVAASAGDLDTIRELEAEHGLEPCLVDTEHALSGAFLTTGTPSGVLIAPDGLIASYLAVGVDEIEALVDRVAEGQAVFDGTAVGSPVPEIELVGLDGALVPLVDPEGGETVLLFWNPGCGYCRSMLDDLRTWERGREAGSPRLLVVSSGDADETVADGLRSTVVLDPDFAVGAGFGANGTPMAVGVGPDGTVASRLLVGGDDVLARLRGVPASMAGS